MRAQKQRQCRRISGLVLLAGAAFLPLSAHAGLTRAETEFSVSSGVAERRLPAVAWMPDHRLLATWFDMADAETPVNRMARVFEANGAPAGDPFAVTPTGEAIIPYNSEGEQTLAVCSDGIFVTAWVALTESPASYQPRLRFFAADGTAASPPIVVNEDIGSSGKLSGLECDAAGNAVLLWRSYHPLIPPYPVRLARYARDGSILLAPTAIVSSAPDAELYSGGLALGSDGSIVVGWTVSTYVSENSKATGYVRRFDNSGTPVAPAVTFASPADDSFLFGRVRTDAAGHVYYAYWIFDRDGTGEPPQLYRFNLDGSGLIAASVPPHPGGGGPENFHVSPTGRVSVVWHGNGASGYSGAHLYLQHYDEDLVPDGLDLQVGDELARWYAATGITMDAYGTTVVALDDHDQSVFADPIVADARLRRFCSDDDPSCALCNGETDNTDTDADGRPDLCDPCSSVDASHLASRARTTVSFGNSVVPSPNYIPIRANAVDVSEVFVLPAGTAFADLPLVADGLRLRIENSVGDALVDVTLPGGVYGGRGTAGWKVGATKTRFLDRTSTPVNGFRKVSVSNLDAQEPGQVEVRVRGRGGRYEVYTSNLPMKAILTLGGGPSAQAGICGESDFLLEECEDEAYGQTLICIRR